MQFTKQDKLKFGIFIGPYHKPGINPTLTFQQDLEIIEQMDRLGFDEAWIGEHHSGGIELVDDPMLTIAAAAERTKHIQFGTGAVTLPWHHPYQIAARIVQLLAPDERPCAPGSRPRAAGAGRDDDGH